MPGIAKLLGDTRTPRILCLPLHRVPAMTIVLLAQKPMEDALLYQVNFLATLLISLKTRGLPLSISIIFVS
jgi:hypothetical protein